MFLCSSPSPPSRARSRALFLAAWTLAAACFPSSASAALTFDTTTKLLGGTISGATIPSVTSTPAAAALLGAVGYSTDANLIYGPFEAGFGGSSATRPWRAGWQELCADLEMVHPGSFLPSSCL